MFRIGSFLTLWCLSTCIATGYKVDTSRTGTLDSSTLKGLDLGEDLLLERLLEEADEEVDGQLKRNEPGSKGSVNGLSLNTEEGIENFIERKIAEVYETKLEDLERKSLLHERKLREHAGKLLSSCAVSFSTQLKKSKHNIRAGETIIFDSVDLNDGDGYSNHTGIFTAPQSGVYMFAYFLGHASANYQVWLQLKHNDKKVNSAAGDNFHEYQDTQGGNLANIRLEKGDTVYIESWHTISDDASLEADGFTTFSGVLLY